jgi:hypothetical protein
MAMHDVAVPLFDTVDINGNVERLSDQAGKVVIVNAWVTWCGPCRSEMPKLDHLYQERKGKGLVVFGISDEDVRLERGWFWNKCARDARRQYACVRRDVASTGFRICPFRSRLYGGRRLVSSRKVTHMNREKWRILLVLCAALSTAWAEPQSKDKGPCASTLADATYFPNGTFDALPLHDSSKNSWYSCTLAALTEPSLFALRNDRSIRVYRFLWLPSFHRPITVRLTINSDGSASIVTRIVDKHGGLLATAETAGIERRDTMKLVLNTTTQASRDQVQKVLDQIQDLGFWSMPTEEPPSAPHTSGTKNEASTVALPPLDGARWILEGVSDGRYHVVDRWSPGNDSYAQLCLYFLKLGKVEVNHIY